MAQEVVHRGAEMRVRAHSKENEEIATHSDAVDEEKEEEEEAKETSPERMPEFSWLTMLKELVIFFSYAKVRRRH